MTSNILRLLVLVTALTPIASWAQGPHPHDPATMVQHRVNFLTGQLGLSSTQQEQATTIFSNAMSGLQPIHQQMRDAHQALQSAVSKGDNAGIDQAATTIGNLTAQMTAARAKADAQLFQILNGDQQAKFTQMHAEGQGMGRRFGHGRPQE
ncbi:MAG TPA: Spy/CpxP family protein refolding chaperone [Candidatus Angelobacter sp.]|nr:Spy/CpxP family protein refolding chaperone [Candidatus Angelobacter sp.]